MSKPKSEPPSPLAEATGSAMPQGQACPGCGEIAPDTEEPIYRCQTATCDVMTFRSRTSCVAAASSNDQAEPLPPTASNPSPESAPASLAPAPGSASVIVAEAYHRLRAAAEPRGGEHPPAAKKDWDHSEMVLVYYAADPEMDHTSAWSIAYYHHKPPFDQKSHWVDFSRSWGTPDYWWPLPELPNR